MASELNLKLNAAGMRNVLRDETLARALYDIGQRVAAAASGHPSAAHPGGLSSFEAEIHRVGGRVSVHVYPTNDTAAFGDPWHHWLIAALDAAR